MKLCSYYAQIFGRQFIPNPNPEYINGHWRLLQRSWEVYKDSRFGAHLLNLIFANAFHVKEKSILAGRRLATLSRGQIALVPPTAQAGDVIYYIPIWSPISPDYSDGTNVFRPFGSESIDHSASLMAMKSFKEYMQERSLYSPFDTGPISELYQHCILLGQGRVFDEGGSCEQERYPRSVDGQKLLVVH
jgi:hypothetical protein